MTKHRIVSGFVAIVLLAAAAVTMRSQSPSTARSVASAELTASANRSPAGNSTDRSPVYSTNR